MSATERTRVYAGFWIRFVAFVIDNIAMGIVLSPFAGLVIKSDMQFDYTDPVRLRAQLIQILTSAGVETLSLVGAALIIAFWIWRAATPGKMVFNAHIVDARSFRRASNMRLVVRYLSYLISFFAFGLGFLWIAFDRRKQGWHDKIAGTVVIVGQPEQDSRDNGTADD